MQMNFLKVCFAVFAAMLVTNCAPTSSGFAVSSVGFSPGFTGKVVRAVDKLTPDIKLENCMAGQVLLSEAEAEAYYQADSNTLNGSGIGAGSFGRQSIDRRNRPLAEVERHTLYVSKETRCVWPRGAPRR
jgi:hypothetical protein